MDEDKKDGGSWSRAPDEDENRITEDVEKLKKEMSWYVRNSDTIRRIGIIIIIVGLIAGVLGILPGF